MAGMRIPVRLVLILGAILTLARPALPEEDPVSRIVFGSCAGQDRPQPFWEPINALRPQLFLFLGDNIYADTVDPVMLHHLYGKLGSQPGYRRLLQSGTTVMATWDDHDYGYNDAGEEHPHKREFQREHLDFFGVPVDSPRRRQEGIYNAQVFGPPGRRVQVIMLDMRYFRTPLKKGRNGAYARIDRANSTFLGEVQWAWLKERLREPADLRLIGSSIQVVANQHPFEKWGNFPQERARLLSVIRESKARGVIILSGDRHQAELSVMRGGVGYDLFDMTASSFNKPHEANNKGPIEANMYRMGRVEREANFGVVRIDWEAPDPGVTLEVHDATGTVRISERVRLSRLRP